MKTERKDEDMLCEKEVRREIKCLCVMFFGNDSLAMLFKSWFAWRSEVKIAYIVCDIKAFL